MTSERATDLVAIDTEPRPGSAVAGSIHAAEAAASRAGIHTRELTALADLEAAAKLYESIWLPSSKNPPVSAELMKALSKAGNYVAGAFDGAELVGACLGFFAPPHHRAMHSHIAGVAAPARGRNVGFALKTHQRAWALLRGVSSISWTFDPLVRRNAYFNVCKLAAAPSEYLPNFYGDMDDQINGSGETDRLLVTWDLGGEQVAAACVGEHITVSAAELRAGGATACLDRAPDGTPVPASVERGIVLIAVPDDIEVLRVQDPDLATQWQREVAAAMSTMLAHGASVVGFDRNGWYAFRTGVIG